MQSTWIRRLRLFAFTSVMLPVATPTATWAAPRADADECSTSRAKLSTMQEEIPTRLASSGDGPGRQTRARSLLYGELCVARYAFERDCKGLLPTGDELLKSACTQALDAAISLEKSRSENKNLADSSLSSTSYRAIPSSDVRVWGTVPSPPDGRGHKGSEDNSLALALVRAEAVGASSESIGTARILMTEMPALLSAYAELSPTKEAAEMFREKGKHAHPSMIPVYATALKNYDYGTDAVQLARHPFQSSQCDDTYLHEDGESSEEREQKTLRLVGLMTRFMTVADFDRDAALAQKDAIVACSDAATSSRKRADECSRTPACLAKAMMVKICPLQVAKQGVVVAIAQEQKSIREAGVRGSVRLGELARSLSTLNEDLTPLLADYRRLAKRPLGARDCK